MAILCGPVLSSLIMVPAWCAVNIEEGTRNGSLWSAIVLAVGIATLAGLIAVGAFWILSSTIRPARRASKRLHALWDPNLDGLP